MEEEREGRHIEEGKDDVIFYRQLAKNIWKQLWYFKAPKSIKNSVWNSQKSPHFADQNQIFRESDY